MDLTQVRKVTRFPIPVRLVYKDPEQHGAEVDLAENLVVVKRYAEWGTLDLSGDKWFKEGGWVEGDFKGKKKGKGWRRARYGHYQVLK